MGQLVIQKDHQLLGKIMDLHNLFSRHEDMEACAKSKELGRKMLEKEFAIAFCGHFSAGKSSMINRLIGEDILPSSPIPTSANLVKIKAGEEYARVFFKEGHPRLYPAPYNYETVKNYCKDGDQIESLEISHKGSGFLDDVTIMDTPGIDSADDAHRIATESALHLADLVIYVMDYNHVQSELNFLFTKELTEAGKELYLVVNMVDKHREEELKFGDFQKSVTDSFAAWGVRPKRVFYTSLKKEELPYNQFSELREFLQDRITHRAQMLPESVHHSLIKVSEDHVQRLTDLAEEQQTLEKKKLIEVPETEWNQLPNEYIQITNKMTELTNQVTNAEVYFLNEVETILKNAYLMPFKTRELAESYLKAMQPEFKVGLFFSKQKTLQERAKRLDVFYQDLTEKVQAQLDWHIKEFLLRLLKENGIQNHDLQAKAQSFTIEFSKELLEQTIKTGAVVSGDYVLNYTNDVAEALKRRARAQLKLYKNDYLAEIQAFSSKEMDEATNAEKHLKILVDTYEKLKSLENKLVIRKEAIFDALYSDPQGKVDYEKAQSLFVTVLNEEVVLSSELQLRQDQPPVQEKPLVKPKVATVEKADIENSQQQLTSLVHKLRATANDVLDLPGLKKISKELIEKADRLENQQFTVALFGAFSAGKSSFANALIGENVLPVSPNPTTAAINKIKPVDAEHSHGTVIVKVKEAKQLLEEVNRSLKLFQLEAVDLSQALKKIATIQDGKANVGAAEKLHHSFLQAFSRGFSLFNDQLGSEFSTNLDSFRSYVADEEKSCFVEWIEVYYDCELTREGISLVDTPGADSINARHTGVAFDYIKNSDAILFVTYYNHAFSRADREFLIQLGRVKDAFELDKMFFIVNAIDLANSEEEMQSVLDYVGDQLVQYGIRNPHMFPVSSLEALKEKVTGQEASASGFAGFEQAFYAFISEELMKMAMDSAEAKWKQSLFVLEKLLHSAQEGEEEKAKKLAALDQEKNKALTLIHEKKPDFLLNQLNQEADELVFYIKQRVFLRFGDFFREAFNPALLKEDGRDLKKALQSALDDLLSSIGYDLLQEMRATTLRIEAFISRTLREFQTPLMTDMKRINDDLLFSAWEQNEFNEIEFEGAFTNLDVVMFNKALALFKNPKTFFESNGKKQMSEELEKLLQKPADDYLFYQNQVLKDHYCSELTQAFAKLLADYIEQIEEYYTGLVSALAVDFPIDQLESTYQKVKKLA